MKTYIFIILFLLIGYTISAQEKAVLRFNNSTKELLKEFSPDKYDIATYKPGEYLDIVLPETEFKKLINQGYDVQITQTEKQLKENLVIGKDLNGYRNYDELLTELQQIEADHPGLCKLYDIGETRGKEYSNNGNSNYDNYYHEVWALKVSDNVEIEEDEPCVYYMGEHHAREPISLEVTMAILNHILNNYGTDPTITQNVNNTQIWFIPLVNPNGHKIVTDEIDLWWRKNICDNNGNGQINPSTGYDYPDGVDPNRNYGFHWGGEGASSDPNSQTYRGLEAFSEPEVQAMRDIMLNHHFVTGITYHSYSELVLFPFGYSENIYAPDNDALEDLAVSMANTIPAQGGGYYDPIHGWELYPCSGTTDDYAYGVYGIFSFTIELATEFIPPAGQVQGICDDNIQASMILLDRVNHSTLTGLISDAQTSEAVVAEIFIQGIDDTGEWKYPYVSDEEFGRYYRLLMDGNYNVTFSSYGYISQTVNNVNITNTSQTILDISMEPAQVLSVSGIVTDGDTGYPIENVTIEVLNTPVDPVTTNSNGEYTIPEIYESTYQFKASKEGYASSIVEATVNSQNNIVNFILFETNAVSFESGTFGNEWSFGGNLPWTITTQDPYDGQYCAVSGNINNNQTSPMYITLDVMAGEISFARKVSSEAGYDYLKFYIDNIMQGQWAGEIGWEEVVFAVTGGEHTFKWVYQKDQAVTGGQDRAWVDYIIFPPLASLTANAGPNAAICEDESYTLSGSATNYNSIEWTTSGDGIFDNSIILNATYTPGNNDITTGSVTLTLTAYGDDGNVSDDMTLTIYPLPNVTLQAFDDVCVYDPPFELTGGEPVGGTYSGTGVTNNWFYPETAGVGTHTITYTYEENGCANSAEENIYVDACTGIAENDNNQAIEIFPNPNNGYFSLKISINKKENISIRILNSIGDEVYKLNQVNIDDYYHVDIELDDLANGLYYLIIYGNETQFVKKIIVQ
ncbi:MAG: carboxypeptidase regulatory-like domain-containing protein [Bacteroidales bacterium]|nr:carboxypeptidase regulatory-like domain-containing protein [Bacteroidales bacterium]